MGTRFVESGLLEAKRVRILPMKSVMDRLW